MQSKLVQQAKNDVIAHFILVQNLGEYKRGYYGGEAHMRAMDNLIASGTVTFDDIKPFFDRAVATGFITLKHIQESLVRWGK